MAAIAGGAKAVATPEVPASVGTVADAVREAVARPMQTQQTCV